LYVAIIWNGAGLKKTEMNNICDYIDHTDTSTRQTSPSIQNYLQQRQYNIFIPLESGRCPKRNVATEYAGCITANTRMWCVPMRRYANCKELKSLQGIDEDFCQVMSNTQFKKQIGNSMSVNFLISLFSNLL
jgi:site-specific DNA-cytosine methylase